MKFVNEIQYDARATPFYPVIQTTNSFFNPTLRNVKVVLDATHPTFTATKSSFFLGFNEYSGPNVFNRNDPSFAALSPSSASALTTVAR